MSRHHKMCLMTFPIQHGAIGTFISNCARVNIAIIFSYWVNFTIGGFWSYCFWWRWWEWRIIKVKVRVKKRKLLTVMNLLMRIYGYWKVPVLKDFFWELFWQTWLTLKMRLTALFLGPRLKKIFELINIWFHQNKQKRA